MDTPTVLPNQFAGTTTMPECAAPAQVPLRPTHVPFRKDRAWENWGRSARCRPELSFYPQTAEDLIRIVNFAREAGKRVRATGSSHSWSALVPTDGVMVYTRRLNRVTMDLSDESRPRVIVESGSTVREVNDVLERHGYALPFNVVLESVRLGGLISTGSHGSGWNHHTLSDLVRSIELVTASGQLRKFEAGVDRDEVMNAVRLDLGMFGLVYRMTLDVQPSWNVRAVDRREPIERTLDNLPELVASAWLITTATIIKVAGFYYASVEHPGEPTWSAHSQFHHVLGIIWLTGLGVASLALAWGPMQRGEKLSLSLLLSTFTFAHIGFFVAQIIVPAGRPPVLWHHLVLAGVALVYATGLFLAWRRITWPVITGCKNHAGLRGSDSIFRSSQQGKN